MEEYNLKLTRIRRQFGKHTEEKISSRIEQLISALHAEEELQSYARDQKSGYVYLRFDHLASLLLAGRLMMGIDSTIDAYLPSKDDEVQYAAFKDRAKRFLSK